MFSAVMYARMLKLCWRRRLPREAAKDVVQEAYLRLLDFQKTARVRNGPALLRRIVINLSINYFNREAPRRCVTRAIVDKLDRRGLLVDPAPDPERVLEGEQEVARVVAVVAASSKRVCEVFLAQRLGYSHSEVALAFGIMPRTVERHVVAAHVTLRESGEQLDEVQP